MKNLYFLLLTFFTLGSCSESQDSGQNLQLSTLSYTERFIPTLDSYTAGSPESSKNVKYYEGNNIVSDLTYDINSNIIAHVDYTYNGLVKTETYFIGSDMQLVKTYIFDEFGRLVELKKENGYSPAIIKFIYGDGTISRVPVDPDTNLEMPQYTFTYSTNNSGLINEVSYSTTTHSTIIYQGEKPTQYLHNDNGNLTETYDFTYYTNVVPSNLQKSVAQINNSFFEESETRIADNCNFYLMSYSGFVTFDKVFNAQNYITYSKAVGALHEEIYDSETFYYYN